MGLGDCIIAIVVHQKPITRTFQYLISDWKSFYIVQFHSFDFAVRYAPVYVCMWFMLDTFNTITSCSIHRHNSLKNVNSDVILFSFCVISINCTRTSTSDLIATINRPKCSEKRQQQIGLYITPRNRRINAKISSKVQVFHSNMLWVLWTYMSSEPFSFGAKLFKTQFISFVFRFYYYYFMTTAATATTTVAAQCDQSISLVLKSWYVTRPNRSKSTQQRVVVGYIGESEKFI